MSFLLLMMLSSLTATHRFWRWALASFCFTRKLFWDGCYGSKAARAKFNQIIFISKKASNRISGTIFDDGGSGDARAWYVRA
jgi:hypothetical protein